MRERLLDAAREVLDEVGEADLTLAQVVSKAGLTTGAVYSNFENREELIVAVHVENFAGNLLRDVGTLREVIESDLDGDEYERAVFGLLPLPGQEPFREARWLRLRAMVAAQRYESVGAAVSELQQQITAHVIETIERGQARGRIDESADPRALALLIQEFGFGLVMSDLSGELAPDPESWYSLLRRLLDPLLPTDQRRTTSPR